MWYQRLPGGGYTVWGVFDHPAPDTGPFSSVPIGSSWAAHFAAYSTGYLSALYKAATYIPIPE